MAGSAQNPPERGVQNRSGGAIYFDDASPPPSSARSLWFGVVLGFLTTATVAISAVAIAREHATQRQLAAMEEGLELLRIERDVSVVATRFITATTMHRYAGGRDEEMERTKEALRESLRTAAEALDGYTPSVSWRPIHQDMQTAVRGMLSTFDDARSPSELVAWADEFLFDYKRVIPTDNLGEWTAVLEVATWVLEAPLVPREYLDHTMARLWAVDGRVPADTTLLDDFQFALASLRRITGSHRQDAISYTPFEEYLDLRSALEAGPEFAEMVRDLRECPVVVQIEGDMPFLLGLSTERSFSSVDALYEQLDTDAMHLADEAEKVRALAVGQFTQAVLASQQRDRLSRLGGALAIVLTLFLSVRYVQRRRRTEHHLRDVAEHDILTALGNRYALFAQAPAHLADPARASFALIHLDLDDFKSINDQFGHHIGDAALVEFADACRESIRSVTDMIVRLGGDEFVIVLFDLEDPEQEARGVIDRIRARLAQPVDVGGEELLLPAAAGFAVSDEPAELQELLVEADLALLAAKKRGRNGLELFRRGLKRTLFRELETAMSNGELQCAFQPQFDLETGRLSGLEALMRWRRPDKKEIETVKLVNAVLWLGQARRWLEIAMRDVETAWQTIGDVFEGRIWVNLAGEDVESATAEELLEILGGTSVPLDRLGVEITEPVLRDDLSEVVGKLRALRDAGLSIALDDVGDDRMPLLHVAELPIDVVKLDRGLVTRIDIQTDRLQVVQSITDLCQRLSLRVVAEGVETAPEEALLRRLGVQYVQGFRFAKAVSLPDIASLRMLEERARDEGGRAEDVA